jgi:hypothetical protein
MGQYIIAPEGLLKKYWEKCLDFAVFAGRAVLHAMIP